MNILSVVLLVMLVATLVILFVQTKRERIATLRGRLKELADQIKFMQSAIDGAKDSTMKNTLYNRVRELSVIRQEVSAKLLKLNK